MSKVRVQPRFYLILFLLSLAAVIIALLLTRERSAMVRSGTLGKDRVFPAIIARDEVMQPSPGTYERIEYYKAEGEEVAKGEEVASVYTSGYSRDMLSELEETRKEIGQASKEKLKSVKEEKLESYNQQVQDQAEVVAKIVRKESDASLIQAEKALRALMGERHNYLRENSHTDSNFQKLFSQEESQKNAISMWSKSVQAVEKGRISLRQDGYEAQFNLEHLESMTPETVTATLQSYTDKPAMSTNTLFRIVNPYRWYLLMVVKDSQWQPVSGQAQLMVRFDGAAGNYTAVINKAVPDAAKKNTLVVLEMHEDIDGLIDARKINVTVLGGQHHGLLVPRSAIRKQDMQDVVMIKGDRRLVPVTVIEYDTQYALIEPAAGSGLQVGDVVLIP